MTLTLKIVNQFFLPDTVPCDDTQPHQVWLKMVEQFKRYHPDKLGHMDRRIDGRTDGHTDEVISIYPSILIWDGGGGL